MDLAQFFADELTRSRLLSSIALIVLLVLVRYLVIGALFKSSSLEGETKRRWIIFVKNISILIFVFALMSIWANEIRNFALSLVAIAAAIVLATKEIILCFIGGLYIAWNRPFEIGDRIELGEFRGDVLEHNWLATNLQEIGPTKDIHQMTGRTILVPNSTFLNTTMVRESKEAFDFHTFKIPIPANSNWQKHERSLLQACQKECAPYLEDAKKFTLALEQRHGIPLPDAVPRVSLSFLDYTEMHLVCRIPVPGLRKQRVEQAIIRRFLLESNPYSDTQTVSKSDAKSDL